jgi:hypothetical protein
MTTHDTARPPDRDTLVRRATAFRSWRALVADMDRTGYFPTLRRHDQHQAELGRILEAEGRRVFWIGRAGR